MAFLRDGNADILGKRELLTQQLDSVVEKWNFLISNRDNANVINRRI